MINKIYFEKIIILKYFVDLIYNSVKMRFYCNSYYTQSISVLVMSNELDKYDDVAQWDLNLPDGKHAVRL